MHNVIIAWMLYLEEKTDIGILFRTFHLEQYSAGIDLILLAALQKVTFKVERNDNNFGFNLNGVKVIHGPFQDSGADISSYPTGIHKYQLRDLLLRIHVRIPALVIDKHNALELVNWCNSTYALFRLIDISNSIRQRMRPDPCG
jgi:hypothetical protein